MKALFFVPESTQYFLAALCAIQELEMSKASVDITIVTPTDSNTYMTPAHWTIIQGSPDSYQPMRGEFDLVFQFDQILAYRFGKDTQLNVACAFGILIGVVCGSIPAGPQPKAAPVYDVGLLDSPISTEIAEWLSQNQPEAKVTLLGPARDVADSERYADIASCKIVVGPQNSETYLACVLGKHVMEFVTASRHGRWLSKWANPGYMMICGDQFRLETFVTGWKGLWDSSRNTV